MECKVSGVYAIVHRASGKRYVGSSVDIARRLFTHLWLLRAGKHNNIKLQRSWVKYGGESAFEFKILETSPCVKKVLVDAEQKHIDARAELNILPRAYSHLGAKRSPQSIERLRRKQLGVIPNEETRAKMRVARANSAAVQAQWESQKGKPVSAETRAKISASVKARMADPALLERLANSLRHSEKAIAVRQATADAMRGKPWNQKRRDTYERRGR